MFILHRPCITSEGLKFLEDEPEDSFKHMLWQQQFEAASKKDARTVYIDNTLVSLH